MKENNNSSQSRSERAKNEPRDSQGRFESKDQKSSSSNMKNQSKTTDHRGMNAKNEPRDSQGRFTSKDNK